MNGMGKIVMPDRLIGEAGLNEIASKWDYQWDQFDPRIGKKKDKTPGPQRNTRPRTRKKKRSHHKGRNENTDFDGRMEYE
jgi:hypothetical protein